VLLLTTFWLEFIPLFTSPRFQAVEGDEIKTIKGSFGERQLLARKKACRCGFAVSIFSFAELLGSQDSVSQKCSFIQNSKLGLLIQSRLLLANQCFRLFNPHNLEPFWRQLKKVSRSGETLLV